MYKRQIAGYTPGKTATIATTVYQLWRTNDEAGALRWVLVDIVISAVVLLAVNPVSYTHLGRRADLLADPATGCDQLRRQPVSEPVSYTHLLHGLWTTKL